MILSGQKDEAFIDTDKTKNAHGQNYFICADFMLFHKVISTLVSIKERSK